MPPVLPSPAEIQVLIAEDHTIVLDGLQLIIEDQPGLRVAARAVDGLSTLARLRDTPCHILLLDLNMPAPSGLPLIRLIRADWPALPILVLSMTEDPDTVRAALQAGASGFVSKNNGPEVLVRALRHVATGGRFVEPHMAEALLFAPVPAAAPRLSPRELQVLAGIGDGQTNSEIARSLSLSEQTISTYKANLMNKLHISSMADLVRFADEQRRLSDAGSSGP